MTSDIELVHQYLRDAISELSEIIDKSDCVEYKLIGVKRKLLEADYRFAGTYLEYLTHRADINIDAKTDEHLSRQTECEHNE